MKKFPAIAVLPIAVSPQSGIRVFNFLLFWLPKIFKKIYSVLREFSMVSFSGENKRET